jgi:hypothetical protein
LKKYNLLRINTVCSTEKLRLFTTVKLGQAASAAGIKFLKMPALFLYLNIWGTVLLEKLIIVLLMEKFPAFCKT